MKKLLLILLCLPYLVCSQSGNTATSLTIIECDSFLWPIDSTTYTNSGLYINIDSSACNPSFVSNYNFLYNGSSTVVYGGQTTRLQMASEMGSALYDPSTTYLQLQGMFENSGSYFSDPALNASAKKIINKTATSTAVSPAVQLAIHASFDSWFLDYATNVAPIVGTTTMAASGSAGMAGNRELNAKGMEYDQIISKSLIGALCLDQVVNNYLSDAKIGDNVDNTFRDPQNNNNATDMEHNWDQAFGYVYGKFGPDNLTGDLGTDGLLGKYLNKYPLYNQVVFNSFKRGRQAIVENCSYVRDLEAQIIKESLSKVVLLRAEHYLREAAFSNVLSPDYFHCLSEAYGFILSLQFTHTYSGIAYFTNNEVNNMLSTLETGNGFWDRTDTELIAMADVISFADSISLLDSSILINSNIIIDSLNLVINNSTSTYTSITSCDSYTWNGQNYNISGTYTSASTNTAGCTHIDSLVLTISNPTSSTNNISICYGESVIVVSNTYSQSGTYTDVISNINGCDSTITTNLTVITQTTSFIAQSGNYIIANALGGNTPYSYEWSTGENTAQITPIINGDYWVVISDANGCVSDTSFISFILIPTYIQDLNIDKLFIYPNPSQNVFNVEFTSLTRHNLKVRIINSIGEIVYVDNANNHVGVYRNSISLKQYSRAIYYLEIQTDNGIVNKKLILQ